MARCEWNQPAAMTTSRRPTPFRFGHFAILQSRVIAKLEHIVSSQPNVEAKLQPGHRFRNQVENANKTTDPLRAILQSSNHTCSTPAIRLAPEFAAAMKQEI